MKISNKIIDNRINAVNCLMETTLGEYEALAGLILKKNQFQRQRVKTSGTIYSLLKSDLKEGIVMPPIVLGLSLELDFTTKDDESLLKAVEENKENLLILDGLQRTYTIRDLLSELSEANDPDLEKIKSHPLRIEIYFGINKLGILYRMLTLNTGQTPMSSRHQIEIIYSDYIDKTIGAVRLIKQIENDTPDKLGEYNFKDIIDGFTSYLERDYLTIERSDILDNIKSLEKLAIENQHKDLFIQFVNTYNHFATKMYTLGSQWSYKQEDFSRKLGGAPFATGVVKIFNKSQVLTGFGSAVGKLIDLKAISSFEEVKILSDQIKSIDINKEFNNLLQQLDNIRSVAKKIGNDQRIFFHFFFREIFDKKSDGYLMLGESINQAYSQYERRRKNKMPIKLVKNSVGSESNLLFSNVAFTNNETGRFFTLSTSSGEQIFVPYVPPFVSSWDIDRYELFLFENPYLTAENDVFEIHENTIAGRIGYIFPVATLDSNENNYIDDKIFRNYRYVAYWKLLQSEFELNEEDSKINYSLSEMFPNICICLLSKDDIVNLQGFKIEDYLLSFLKYDYLIYHNSINGKAIFNKTSRIKFLREGSHKITVKKASFDILSTQFTKSLFIDHLYQSENFLVKYILLYQILEHFIQEIGDTQLDEVIASYKANTISKNTVKEKIAKLSNDRSLLKKTFSKTPIDRTLRVDFVEKCGYLFTDIGEEVQTNFENAIYDFRNLVTHRYRSISSKTDEVKEVIQNFELIIIELLINFHTRTGEEETEEEINFTIPTRQDTLKPKNWKYKLRKFICQKILKCEEIGVI